MGMEAPGYGSWCGLSEKKKCDIVELMFVT